MRLGRSRSVAMGEFVAILCGSIAGIAQLVERNLAKVEVESSRLFSRSKVFDRLGFAAEPNARE
jgi:hypothetical protein